MKYNHRSLTNCPASSPACSTHSIMKKIVIYARYSSDRQTEQSIEGQLRVCHEYAERNDYVVVHEYIDRALSGATDRRPAFLQMIEDSKKKEFEYVLVYQLDRFARNRYDSANYKMKLKKNGVRVLSARENISDDASGILMESVLEGMAEYYSAELSQKVKRGMNETRLKGNFTGGNLIYGYKVENHKILINEEQAKVVRYIYEQYALGVYVKDIIQKLNDKHIYNRGKPFARNTIYNILKNEKYSGIYRHNNEVFENMYPRIVSQEIYDKVRKKTSQNHYGKRSIEVVYLLRNKLKCGYCGEPISAECGTSSKGNKRRYYKCLGKKRYTTNCNKQTVRKEILEDLVNKILIEQLNSPKTLDKIAKNILKLQESEDCGNTLLTNLNKEKYETQKILDNILKAVEQRVVNNTTNKRMTELEKKLEDIERHIIVEKSKTNFKLTKEDILNYFNEALKLELQLLINYLVNQIILYDDKMQIYFNSPSITTNNTTKTPFKTKTYKLPHIIQNKPQPEMIDIMVKFYV